MAEHIEINPADHITVGTLGNPGQRTFYLQGAQGNKTISLTIEKMQANSLQSGLADLITEIDKRQGSDDSDSDMLVYDLRLRNPIEPLFRVGNMGLGFSEEVELFVVVSYEIPLSEEEVDSEDLNAVSFWVTREQVTALIPHIETIIGGGRPICGNCGKPMEPEGHFCAKKNGHKH